MMKSEPDRVDLPPSPEVQLRTFPASPMDRVLSYVEVDNQSRVWGFTVRGENSQEALRPHKHRILGPWPNTRAFL